jgi:hypothetical protein
MAGDEGNGGTGEAALSLLLLQVWVKLCVVAKSDSFLWHEGNKPKYASPI